MPEHTMFLFSAQTVTLFVGPARITTRSAFSAQPEDAHSTHRQGGTDKWDTSTREVIKSMRTCTYVHMVFFLQMFLKMSNVHVPYVQPSHAITSVLITFLTFSQVERIIEEADFEFPCRFSSDGCDFTGVRAELKRHEEENCGLRPIRCEFVNCGKVLKARDINKHLMQVGS